MNGGLVKAELRDKFVLDTEQLFIGAGAESYEQGAQQFAKLLEFLHSNFHRIQTKEQLGAVLDELPEPSWKERLFILGGVKYLPHLIHFGIKQLTRIADKTLPAVPSGRPGIDLQTREKVIAHVGRQHTKGYSLEQAKWSAARKFGISNGTVQRLWDDRASIGEADFRFVVKFFTDGPDAE
jgi:hypothetical protein